MVFPRASWSIRMVPNRCYSHNLELGIRYSSVAPAIDMEHDEISEEQAGLSCVVMNVKLMVSKIHLCFSIGCQHLIPILILRLAF